MKKGKVAIEVGGVLTSEECIECGKAIAAMPLSEALCCECRYGRGSYKDHDHEPLDSFEYMRGRAGVRLKSGFSRIDRHQD